MADPISITDLDPATLAALLQTWGHKPVHSQRILRAFYAANGTPNWAEVGIGTHLPRKLDAEVGLRSSQVIDQRQSSDGTTKLLIAFRHPGSAEAVLMPGYRDDRAAGCVSSQIGCAMGCDFCASTRHGLERNLSAGEIVEQYLHLREHAQQVGRRLTSLVFMGMGEPMHNLDNVVPAIRRIADPDMGGLGWRQVTVSTVGVVPGIDRLADADLNVHLALSLHAPDDATRSRLVPANRRYPIAEIICAARRFYERTRRVVTIEYCLLAGVNDSEEQADLLARLLTDFRAHVNLIPYNATGPGISGISYRRPDPVQVDRFLARLRASGVVAHRRDTRGDDVAAACGQLRALTVMS